MKIDHKEFGLMIKKVNNNQSIHQGSGITFVRQSRCKIIRKFWCSDNLHVVGGGGR
jgi:hypothetical protein